ncbi:hypothetical protein, partial [Enterocloster bolteae]|uniref:hypothetical protein n=1 Tax=Enterocloster bolteae TaxID=208479 RepID=UPI00210886D3
MAKDNDQTAGITGGMAWGNTHNTITQSADGTNSRRKAGFRHIPVRLGWSMFSYIKNAQLFVKADPLPDIKGMGHRDA